MDYDIAIGYRYKKLGEIKHKIVLLNNEAKQILIEIIKLKQQKLEAANVNRSIISKER